MGKFFAGILGGKGGNGKGGGSGTGSSSSSSSLERALASKNAAENMKKNGGKVSAQDRYEQILQGKIEANKAALLSGANRSNHTLVGKAKASQEQSKTTKLTMELLAQKMAKNQMKKMKQKANAIEVKPAALGGAYGGFIDKKGRVTNSYGQQVLQIDLKTGKIKTVGGWFGGATIGTYDPNSSYCFFKMQKKIEEFNIKKGLGTTNIWGAKSEAPGSAASSNPWSIYGSNPND